MTALIGGVFIVVVSTSSGLGLLLVLRLWWIFWVLRVLGRLSVSWWGLTSFGTVDRRLRLGAIFVPVDAIARLILRAIPGPDAIEETIATRLVSSFTVRAKRSRPPASSIPVSAIGAVSFIARGFVIAVSRRTLICVFSILVLRSTLGGAVGASEESAS